jgi:hypothetical protein
MGCTFPGPRPRPGGETGASSAPLRRKLCTRCARKGPGRAAPPRRR